jgi:hypothetical protein
MLRLSCAFAAALAMCVGCAEKKPAIFDTRGMDQIHTLLVVPLQSPQDASAGPVVSGMIGVKLQSQRLPKLSVLEPPVLWRVAASQAGAAGLKDEEAVQVAREMGADAVLTGTVTYGVKMATPGDLPGAMRESMKDVNFQQDFAARQGSASVNIRIVSLSANRPVYAHSGTAGGAGGTDVLRQAYEAALKPFEDYIRNSR